MHGRVPSSVLDTATLAQRTPSWGSAEQNHQVVIQRAALIGNTAKPPRTVMTAATMNSPL